jgi:hypothetical protein
MINCFRVPIGFVVVVIATVSSNMGNTICSNLQHVTRKEREIFSNGERGLETATLPPHGCSLDPSGIGGEGG